MSDLDDLYHTCRWCRYFEGGKCFNDAFGGTELDVMGVYEVAEAGRLSGVIEETLNSVSTSKLEGDLVDVLKGYKLSDKRLKEFTEVLRECLSEFYDMRCTEALDEAISKLYQQDAESRCKEAKSGGGVEIADPHSFYCKNFL